MTEEFHGSSFSRVFNLPRIDAGGMKQKKTRGRDRTKRAFATEYICKVCGETMPAPTSHKRRHEIEKDKVFYGF